MRDKNTIGPVGYLFYNLWFFLISTSCYRNVCFRHLARQSIRQSKQFFWLLAITCLVVGFVLTCRRRRNWLSLIVTVSFPLGVYTVLSCWLILKPGIIVVGLLCTAAAGFYLYLLMDGPLTRPRVIRRLQWFALGSRTIFSLGLLSLTTFLCITGLFHTPPLHATVEPTAFQQPAQSAISDHVEQLAPLVDGSWKDLSLTQRLDVLQVIANLEAQDFGLNHELYVTADVLDDNVGGYYNDVEQRIVVDVYCLQNRAPMKLVDTICHEAHHAAAYLMTQVYDSAPEELRTLSTLRRYGQYKAEFANYVSGSKGNFFTYYEQAVEQDARRHAELASDQYFIELCTLLNERQAKQSEPAS